MVRHELSAPAKRRARTAVESHNFRVPVLRTFLSASLFIAALRCESNLGQGIWSRSGTRGFEYVHIAEWRCGT